MAVVTDGAVLPTAETAPTSAPAVHYGELATALIAVGGLAGAARYGSVALLVAVAVVQALLIASWFVAVAGSGRVGGAVVAVAASAGADFAVTHWPHGRLGTLLPVLALAVPVLFVHQLARGAARVRLIESLSSVSLLALAVIALPALVQLRHEFRPDDLGGHVAGGVVAAIAGALVAGYLVDMLITSPRFDPDVARGLPALVVAAVVGAGIGHVVLRQDAAFASGRAAFVGAGCGVVAALISVAASFAVSGAELSRGRWAERLRPVFAVCLVPAVIAPGAFLLCLAIRT